MAFESLIGTLQHRMRLLGKFWELERRRGGGLPNPSLLARGFLTNRAWLYPFDDYDRSLFLTDLEIEARLPRLNTPRARSVLGDKREFHRWAAAASLPTAHLLGFVKNGQALAPDGRPLGNAAIDKLGVIAKPVDGNGGSGVRFIRSACELPPSGHFLLEEKVIQHEYADRIYPDAVNTIRVMVGRRPGGDLILLGAAHRFGTDRSAPTDNFKAGGIVSLVDFDTGRLSEAVVDNGGPGRETIARHPTTLAPIAGVLVPEWRSVCSLALMATDALPGLTYVGWDIAMTRSGPIIVEGNAGLANPNLVQFHRPILLRPEVRRFFAETGVISGRRIEAIEAGKLR